MVNQVRKYESNKWFRIGVLTTLPIFIFSFIMYLKWANNYEGNPSSILFLVYFLLTWPGVVYTSFYTAKFLAEYRSKKNKQKSKK
jgi:hypothetical protein